MALPAAASGKANRGSGAAMAERPVLVLLHGLGANRHVWDGVAELWDGVTYAPDIRGHGRAPRRAPYSFGAMAADIAEALQRGLQRDPLRRGGTLNGRSGGVGTGVWLVRPATLGSRDGRRQSCAGPTRSCPAFRISPHGHPGCSTTVPTRSSGS